MESFQDKLNLYLVFEFV